MKPDKNYATPEQMVYAGLLDWGMKIGFILLVITFSIYALGLAAPHIPLDQLPHYWTLPVGEYLKVAQVQGGWSWLHLIHRGDFMNFIGISFLSAVTIVCYLRILPILFKNRDMIYAVISLLEVVVLVLAASGILASGH